MIYVGFGKVPTGTTVHGIVDIWKRQFLFIDFCLIVNRIILIKADQFRSNYLYNLNVSIGTHYEQYTSLMEVFHVCKNIQCFEKLIHI